MGYNMNYTKPLLRLMRNRGVLSALSNEDKLKLGSWLTGGTRGQLAGWMHMVGRCDLHKLVKEALVCLMESCNTIDFKLVRGTRGEGGGGGWERMDVMQMFQDAGQRISVETELVCLAKSCNIIDFKLVRGEWEGGDREEGAGDGVVGITSCKANVAAQGQCIWMETKL